MLRTGALLGVMLVLSGCMLGPDYVRPEQELPGVYQHAMEGWKTAAPGQTDSSGDWWQLYQDPELAGLLEQLEQGNQNLAAAEAAWREARAALGGSRSALYPSLGVEASDKRSSAFAKEQKTDALKQKITKERNTQLRLNWELDLWGAVRRQVEAGQARLEASAAEWAALRLSQQSLLVQSYIQLRSLDEQLRINSANMDAYQRVLRISENRYQAGMVTRADVSQALTQLKNTEVQQFDLQSQRTRTSNAIAVLLGQPASSFALASTSELPSMPLLPQSLPSSLLERRPDVAAAEQQVMAANAEIGVAKTAYFPTFGFSASGGYRADAWSGLISTPNRFWSLGPQLDLRLFDAGARRAKLQQAEAAYDQQVANYRQTTLEAIAEVEDALVQLLSLEREHQVQAEALAAARDALVLIENQYAAGMVDFTVVSNALTTAHNAERTLLGLQTSRLTASVQLISALGGGWDAADTPTAQ